MSRSPGSIADFDSAAAFMRANADFLRGRDFPGLGLGRAYKPLAMTARLLPWHLRRQVYIAGGWLEAIPPRALGSTSVEEICEWVESMYPARRYPAVAIGSSNGAATHLYCALGIPWLPQTWLIPVRQAVHPDEPRQAMEIGREPGRVLLAFNPDVQLHHMHDANQDRLMVRRMTYFRVKRRRLGDAYERLLEQRLPPGGTIFLTECRNRWQTTRIAERHVFQHGAPGGATEEEFHGGGERVREYLRRYASHRDEWDGPEPDTDSAEAEWGFEDSLREDVERFAAKRRYRVRRIVFDEPDDLSSLVADLYRWWYARRRIPTNRLVVECFAMIEPWWVLRTGSVPFWMKFATEPSAESLETYLRSTPPFDEIHLTLFQHGVEGVGVVPIARWRRVLAQALRHGAFLGVDPDAHPRDFGAFADYHTQLTKIPSRFPIPGRLTLRELDAFLDASGDRYPVSWEDVEPRVAA